MTKLTNDDVDFMRADMNSNYGYSRIRMIGEFATKCKEENPNISEDELMEKIREFKKEKGWDDPKE